MSIQVADCKEKQKLHRTVQKLTTIYLDKYYTHSLKKKEYCKISRALAESICCHWTLWFYFVFSPSFFVLFQGSVLFCPINVLLWGTQFYRSCWNTKQDNQKFVLVPSYFYLVLLIFSSRLFLYIKTTQLFSFPWHRPQEVLFLPKSLLLVPKSLLSFDTIFSLSLVSICSSLRLAHKSCILLNSVVSPALAQVLLSSSSVFQPKMICLTLWPEKIPCILPDILPSGLRFSTTGIEESLVLPEGRTSNIHIFTGTFLCFGSNIF